MWNSQQSDGYRKLPDQHDTFSPKKKKDKDNDKNKKNLPALNASLSSSSKKSTKSDAGSVFSDGGSQRTLDYTRNNANKIIDPPKNPQDLLNKIMLNTRYLTEGQQGILHDHQQTIVKLKEKEKREQRRNGATGEEIASFFQDFLARRLGEQTDFNEVEKTIAIQETWNTAKDQKEMVDNTLATPDRRIENSKELLQKKLDAQSKTIRDLLTQCEDLNTPQDSLPDLQIRYQDALKISRAVQTPYQEFQKVYQEALKTKKTLILSLRGSIEEANDFDKIKEDVKGAYPDLLDQVKAVEAKESKVLAALNQTDSDLIDEVTKKHQYLTPEEQIALADHKATIERPQAEGSIRPTISVESTDSIVGQEAETPPIVAIKKMWNDTQDRNQYQDRRLTIADKHIEASHEWVKGKFKELSNKISKDTQDKYDQNYQEILKRIEICKNSIKGARDYVELEKAVDSYEDLAKDVEKLEEVVYTHTLDETWYNKVREDNITIVELKKNTITKLKELNNIVDEGRSAGDYEFNHKIIQLEEKVAQDLWVDSEQQIRLAYREGKLAPLNQLQINGKIRELRRLDADLQKLLDLYPDPEKQSTT